MFLFVGDVMFHSSLHTSILNTLQNSQTLAFPILCTFLPHLVIQLTSTVCFPAHPCSTGSLPNPSQFLPPCGTLPNGPTLGANSTWTPFPFASCPIASPLWYMRSLFHVAPVVIPAGKAVIKSAYRIPKGPSCEHIDGNPNRYTAPVLPTHLPYFKSNQLGPLSIIPIDNKVNIPSTTQSTS